MLGNVVRHGAPTRSLWPSALFVVLSLEPARAWAADAAVDPLSAEPPDDARIVYGEAARAYEERRYDDAIRLFRRADELRPNPAFDFNVGLAYEDMGDPARALAFYRSYTRRAPHAPDRADVDQRIERLERVLEKASVQQVTITSEPSGARVEIDGVPVGVTPWTGEIQRGFHRLEVDLRGYRTEERTFDLPPQRAIDVPVTLSKEAPRPAVPVPAPPPPSQACVGACLRAIDTSSWLVFGVGVASLGGALGFELYRQEREDTAQAEPNQVQAARTFDEAFAAQKWATALVVTGGALVVTGGILALIDIDEAKNPEPVAFRLGCGPVGCAASYAHSF